MEIIRQKTRAINISWTINRLKLSYAGTWFDVGGGRVTGINSDRNRFSSAGETSSPINLGYSGTELPLKGVKGYTMVKPMPSTEPTRPQSDLPAPSSRVKSFKIK